MIQMQSTTKRKRVAVYRCKRHQRHHTDEADAEVCEEHGNATAAIHLLALNVLTVWVVLILLHSLICAQYASAALQVELFSGLQAAEGFKVFLCVPESKQPVCVCFSTGMSSGDTGVCVV